MKQIALLFNIVSPIITKPLMGALMAGGLTWMEELPIRLFNTVTHLEIRERVIPYFNTCMLRPGTTTYFDLISAKTMEQFPMQKPECISGIVPEILTNSTTAHSIIIPFLVRRCRRLAFQSLAYTKAFCSRTTFSLEKTA